MIFMKNPKPLSRDENNNNNKVKMDGRQSRLKDDKSADEELLLNEKAD